MILSACLVAVAAAGCARIETRPVWYATEPKTPDEQAVAQVLEGLIIAFNERNYDQLFAYYAPEAKIESLAACGVVSREQHRAAVIANKYLPKEELGNTRIKMASPDEARAEGELRLLYSWGPDDSSGPHAYTIVYSLIRRDGQWLVIEERLPGVLLLKLAKRTPSPASQQRGSGFTTMASWRALPMGAPGRKRRTSANRAIRSSII